MTSLTPLTPLTPLTIIAKSGLAALIEGSERALEGVLELLVCTGRRAIDLRSASLVTPLEALSEGSGEVVLVDAQRAGQLADVLGRLERRAIVLYFGGEVPEVLARRFSLRLDAARAVRSLS